MGTGHSHRKFLDRKMVWWTLHVDQWYKKYIRQNSKSKMFVPFSVLLWIQAERGRYKDNTNSSWSQTQQWKFYRFKKAALYLKPWVVVVNQIMLLFEPRLINNTTHFNPSEDWFMNYTVFYSLERVFFPSWPHYNNGFSASSYFLVVHFSFR